MMDRQKCYSRLHSVKYAMSTCDKKNSYSVVCVCTCTGKLRIGVLNAEGKALGFVFSDNTSVLSVFRHEIDDQVPLVLIITVSDICVCDSRSVFCVVASYPKGNLCDMVQFNFRVFLANVKRANVNYLLLPVRLSVVCLSVVCNVCAPYSGGSNFRQYFYGIRYFGHPLTSTENFTEIVPGEPLYQGS